MSVAKQNKKSSEVVLWACGRASALRFPPSSADSLPLLSTYHPMGYRKISQDNVETGLRLLQHGRDSATVKTHLRNVSIRTLE